MQVADLEKLVDEMKDPILHLYNFCLLHIYHNLNIKKSVNGISIDSKSKDELDLIKDYPTHTKKEYTFCLRAYLINLTAAYLMDRSKRLTDNPLLSEGEYRQITFSHSKKKKSAYLVPSVSNMLSAIIKLSKPMLIMVHIVQKINKDDFITNNVKLFMIDENGIKLDISDDLQTSYSKQCFILVHSYSIINQNVDLDEHIEKIFAKTSFHKLLLAQAEEHPQYPNEQPPTILKENRQCIEFYGVRSETRKDEYKTLPPNQVDCSIFHVSMSSIIEAKKMAETYNKHNGVHFNEKMLSSFSHSNFSDYNDLYPQLLDEQMVNYARDHYGIVVNIIDLEHDAGYTEAGTNIFGYNQIDRVGNNIYIGYYNHHYVVIVQNGNNLHIIDPLRMHADGDNMRTNLEGAGYAIQQDYLWRTRLYRN